MSLSFYVNKQFIPIYLILLIGAGILAFFSYRRLRDEFRMAWLLLFISLRTLLFFLIFSALFSLILELRFSKEEKPLVAVLLDSSGSMEQTENDSTRTAVAKRYINRKLLPHIGNQAGITFFLFSDNIYEQGDTAKVNKGATMIGTALERIATAQSRAPSAVFLLSDGRNTSGKDPVEVAERTTFPVYTVKIGDITAANNLHIAGLRVNPIVYKGDSVPLSVILSNSGPERKNVSLTLARKGNIVARRTIPAIEEGIEFPVQLDFVPTYEGIQSYEVSVAALDEETNTEDNRRNFSVRVLGKRKKVVLISHQLNWDYRFLREFLNSQQDIEPICYARISDTYFLIQHLKDTKSGALTIKALLSADIVILINPKGIEQKLYDAITKRVARDGTGLLIMGNKLPSFSSFKETYPLVLAGGTGTGDVIAVPTKEGFNSPLFRIQGDVPTTFPPLSNPLHVRMAKSPTTVYLEAKAKSGEASVPLFCAINFGSGKIAALPAENLWHWKTLPLATGSSQMLYNEVLNNLLKWLIARKEEERLVLYAEKTKLLWGEPLTVSAALYDEMMNPLEGGMIIIHVEHEGSAVADFTMKDVGGGNYEKALGVLEPGIYTVRAETRFPESIRATPSFSFQIEEQEIEKLNTEPDHLLLRNIAEASGGTCLETADPLTDIHLEPSLIQVQKRFHFGKGFVPFLLIAAIFFSELLLRKRKGLR